MTYKETLLIICHLLNDLSHIIFVLFLARIFNIHRSGVLTALFDCCMAGATWHSCRLDTSSVYTIQPVYSVTSFKAT